MLKLLGKDLQDLGGDLNRSARVVESYPTNGDLDDTLTTLFPGGVARWFICGVGGDVKVLLRNGSAIVIPGCIAGVRYEVECVKIIKTLTVATKISVYF